MGLLADIHARFLACVAQLGMLSKAEELEKLNAEARRKELEDLKAANIAAKEEEARKLKEQAKRYGTLHKTMMGRV